MGYKALITLDLSATTEEQRKIFYEVLAENSWIKINSLTTAWKRTFSDFVNRNDAERTLILDMSLAKNKSKISKVEYALQMDSIKDVIVGNI
jgi:hypothetical protein